VIGVADGYQGLSRIYENRPDLVIMAEQAPGVMGKELCSRLRQVSYLPIIVLGSGQEATDEVSMLEAGADAYMSRPPDTVELVARVRSLLRRRNGPAGGGGEGDLSRREKGGDLTSTEFRLLSCLMLNEGGLVSHRQLIAEVWASKPVSVDCLKFYVRRLRQKLSAVLSRPGYILNRRGVGYCFCRTI
jgi:DNA-binding response OmpR family regulator